MKKNLLCKTASTVESLKTSLPNFLYYQIFRIMLNGNVAVTKTVALTKL